MSRIYCVWLGLLMPLVAAQDAGTTELAWGVTAGPLTRTILPQTTWTPATNIVNQAGVSVGSDFDAGNGYIISSNVTSSAHVVDMAIAPDPFSRQDNKTFLGKFLVRLTNVQDTSLIINILNAGDVNVGSDVNETRWQTYASTWQGRASYDFENWFLVPTAFVDNSTLVITHTPIADVVWYAYFPPYPLARLELAIGKWGQLPAQAQVSVTTFGQSVLGQELFLITVGSDCAGKIKFWVTGGQHPSETHGVYFVEGLADAAANALLTKMPTNDLNATFFEEACLMLVPTINPDGMLLGHHRTNALGNNLNRVWNNASMSETPEVYTLQSVMMDVGVDFYLDAHADEDNMGHFIFYAEGICNTTSGGVWNSTFDTVKDAFETALRSVNPEYSGFVPQGSAYDPDPPCEASLRFSDNWVGSMFGVVAGTLEMPFQDIEGFINEETGFSPERAYNFGQQAFGAFQMVLPDVQMQRAAATAMATAALTAESNQ